LALMQRQPGTVLDRTIASEIALRDGARAVILPTVAEVGGKVRVSAEVIDPHTQATVYAEFADGTGAASTLRSIDHVTAALRGRLGEAVESIEKTSAPLPQVSTANLDALRAYALAQHAYARVRFAEALRFYERATRIDPQFALAWIGQSKIQVATQHAPDGVFAIRKAQALRARLPQREALYLDAWASVFDAPADTSTKWQDLAGLYPDFWPAVGNSATWLFSQNRLHEALPYARRWTAQQYELASHGYDMLGRLYLGMERYPEAARAFDQALALGFVDCMRRRASVESAQRRFAEASRWLRRAGTREPYPYLDRISAAVDQGRWAEAVAASDAAFAMVEHQAGLDRRIFPLPAATAHWMAGDAGRARSLLGQAQRLALASLQNSPDADAEDDAALAASSALLALRFGDVATASPVPAALKSQPKVLAIPKVAELVALVEAEAARRAHAPARAIALLEPLVTGHEQYQTHVALLEAYADAGRLSSAIEQARWLQHHRGLAYIELGGAQVLQALNVYDSNLAILREAELQQASNHPADAARALRRFDAIWPVEVLPAYLRVRRDAVAAASRLGTV
ncbi:MAG TPA: putative peptide modification system cyclase, partial [Xanthomonadaceae bacterium]|nr:putative peptide modification system cyclase [Xanthomonadaceae bacterium]